MNILVAAGDPQTHHILKAVTLCGFQSHAVDLAFGWANRFLATTSTQIYVSLDGALVILRDPTLGL